LSEEKRFRSGFTGVPNELYLANLNDRDALYAFLRFEGDTFFGGLKSVREYEQILKLGHRRVKRLLAVWQAQMSQPSSNRISTESQPDVSPATADGCGDGVPKPTEQTHTNQPSPSIYVQKQNQKQTREESPDAERLTILFADTLASAAEEHGISRRKQTRPPRAWFVEMDRLLRLDGIDASEVEEVLLWAITESDFWGTGSGQGVLQSVPKLRKHWDIIASQRAESQPRGRFDVAKRVLAASEGGKRGHRRESVALRLLGK
jgi:hypothetical protein